MARKHSKTSTTAEEFEPLDPSDLGLSPEDVEGGDLAEGEAEETAGEEPAGK